VIASCKSVSNCIQKLLCAYFGSQRSFLLERGSCLTTRSTRRITRKCAICQEKCIDCVWFESLKGFLCPRCTLSRQVYTLANEIVIGVPLKRLPAFSLEFEVASRDQEALDQALILLKYQYKRTSDNSVDEEYKSPIYANVRAFRKSLAVLHDLRGLVNERCGTHLHVACMHKERLCAIQSEVFSPLLDHMLRHPEQTIQFWGRFFSNYATAPNVNRYHCFNLESRYPTLEFRLPRFRTAQQYLRIVQYCRAVVALLDKAVAEEQHERTQKMRVVSPSALGRRVLTLYKHYVKDLPAHDLWLDEQPGGDTHAQDDPEEDTEDEDNELLDWDDF
jgi:hypothetical protein